MFPAAIRIFDSSRNNTLEVSIGTHLPSSLKTHEAIVGDIMGNAFTRSSDNCVLWDTYKNSFRIPLKNIHCPREKQTIRTLIMYRDLCNTSKKIVRSRELQMSESSRPMHCNVIHKNTTSSMRTTHKHVS